MRNIRYGRRTSKPGCEARRVFEFAGVSRGSRERTDRERRRTQHGVDYCMARARARARRAMVREVEREGHTSSAKVLPDPREGRVQSEWRVERGDISVAAGGRSTRGAHVLWTARVEKAPRSGRRPVILLEGPAATSNTSKGGVFPNRISLPGGRTDANSLRFGRSITGDNLFFDEIPVDDCRRRRGGW